jgi:hypothetical protein
MEAVSRAAGEPWSDAPRCSHPLLGHLARLVNDALSDDARQQLLGYVPVLVDASSNDPATYPRVAAACTTEALRTRPSLLTVHLHRAAHAQLRREAHAAGADATARGRLVLQASRALYRRGPGARAVENAVAVVRQLPGPERDAALLGLLDVGLDAVGMRAVAGRGTRRSATVE